MSGLVITLALVLGATSAVVAGVRFARAWRHARGARLITCPETAAPAAVIIDAVNAGLAAAVNEHATHLKNCSRWPERQDCNQACLSQIEEARDGCLARRYALDWYAGKSCVLCGTQFADVNWFDHQPALRSEDGTTIEWTNVAVERLPDVMRTHEPVCWSCHIAESFRRRFPDAVVDREDTALRDRAVH